MSALKPNILNASHFIKQAPEYSPMRIVMDYEFDFYMDHNRKMVINDTCYNIGKNNLVFRTPGQVVQSIGDYDCYILSLNFTDSPLPKNYSRNHAIVMQPECDSELLKIIPPVFTPTHADDIRNTFKKLTYEYRRDGNTEVTHNIVMQLLLQIASDCYSTSDITYNHTNDVVWDICYYLSENLKDEIDLDFLCQKFGFNKSYLIRKFKKEIGLSPINYLINLRLDNAEKLLKRTDYSVKEISYMCGYQDPTFFSTSFKRKFGVSPLEYRNIKKTASK